MSARIHPLTRWLERAPQPVFAAYAMGAAFVTYFCMYGFRKPFAVATFDGDVDLPGLPPVAYKIILIIAQVLGYCLSKFVGVRIVSEMSGRHRAAAIVACVALAEGALLLFAVVPTPWDALCMFLNGFPLGMIWGFVFGFLEGRRTSEALGAGLSASYIVASGFVKTVGKLLMEQGVSEQWMPFVTGLFFLPIILVAVWLLSKLPPPSEEDERLRVRRAPMDAGARRAFLVRFAPGMIALTLLYMLLTAYRDFRDNFAREIWDSLGYGADASVLTTAELPIAVGVLAVLALIMFIKDNRRALLILHCIMIAGAALIGGATALLQAGLIGPAPFMVLVGLGLYIGYVPFGCVLFDRLIAAVGTVATAGFMIYVADAFGYLGSVLLLLYKNFGHPDLPWIEFFYGASYVTSAGCILGFVASLIYFAPRTHAAPDAPGG